MARSKSSSRWLQEHFNDPYVQKAQEQGRRSRAAFKLLEIQQKDQLIKPGARVVDLGAAPGGWCEVAVELAGAQGSVLALDILPMDPIEGVAFIEGDFTEDEPLAALEALLEGERVDVVMSDMAPNLSGIAVADQARAMYLAELAQAFARDWLVEGGDFLVKVFQGEGFDEFLQSLRSEYAKVLVRKPDSSRSRSREVYMLGRGYKGAQR